MSYVTQATLEQAFTTAEIAQLAPDGSGGIDAPQVAEACERASRLADSYLASAGRYVVPIASPGSDLKGAVADIARADLYDQAEPEAIAKRRDRAIAWLRDIAAGRAVLFDAESMTASSVPGAAVVAPAVVFSDATLARMA